MNYLPIDFEVLSALNKQNPTTVDALWTELSRASLAPITLLCVASILAALAADGYVTVARDCLTPDTTVALTDKGRAAVAIGGLSRLFARARIKAGRRNMKSFCALPRPDALPLAWDREQFPVSSREDSTSSHIPMLFTVEDGEEETYTVTFSYDRYNEEDLPMEPVVLTCDLETLRQMLADLLDTALALTENNRTRKVALHGFGESYVMTFSMVAEEPDEYGSTRRMTIAPILFNRRRFIGKRDSELDYAQCGDNLITRTDDVGAGDIYYAAMLRPDHLDDTLGEKMNALYRKVNP